MTQVYKVLDEIKDHFLENGITKRVTFGYVEEISLDKTQVFPIAHIQLVDATYTDHTVVLKLLVMTMDVVNVSKTQESEDDFFGGDDLQDVLNLQFVAITKLINSLRKGALYDEKIRLSDEPIVEMFYDRFENMLAGWGGEILVEMPNDISYC